MNLTFGELVETPLGPISFYAGDSGLKRLAFLPLNVLKRNEDFNQENPSIFGLETVGVLLMELNEYLFGIRKEFSITIDWNVMNGFQKDVLAVTMEIPFGQVHSYGEIARCLGKPGAARAVGMALGRNPIPIIFPCHRVIGADGGLRGYTNGIQSKAFLLGLEGHKIKDGKLNNLSINRY